MKHEQYDEYSRKFIEEINRRGINLQVDWRLLRAPIALKPYENLEMFHFKEGDFVTLEELSRDLIVEASEFRR